MRGSVSYIILEEPDIKTLAVSAVLQPLVSQRFVYQEVLEIARPSVDTLREQMLVLTKRTRPPELYRLPLSSVESHELQLLPGSADHCNRCLPQGFEKPGLPMSIFTAVYGNTLACQRA